MTNLPNSLVKQASSYSQLPDKEKKKFFQQLYDNRGLSWSVIAKMCGTYTNKVRRDAVRLGIESRSKSEAQALALSTGRHHHPTKDKCHSKTTKIRISESVAEDWDNMTTAQRQKKRDEAKERWNKKTDEEIRQFREAAGEGVRTAAKEGSALEKYLLEELISVGYKVEFHKEHWVIREKLQIDLFLPELNIALEVDGPSHFKDIWGKDNLRKNKLRDNEKTGLLLQRGCVIIRVRQKQSLSQRYKRDILKSVLNALRDIETKRPQAGKRHIILGD